MAHMDELSMLVKRVETDGTLHMTQLGVMYPGNFGLGPVALLGDQQTLSAVLTLALSTPPRRARGSGRRKPDQGDRAHGLARHVYVGAGSFGGTGRHGVHPHTGPTEFVGRRG